jgi:TonB family protein
MIRKTLDIRCIACMNAFVPLHAHEVPRMMSSPVALSLLALAFAASQSPVAPAPASAPGQPPKAGWQVDWGKEYCTLARQFQPAGVVFAFRVVPGLSSADAAFIGAPAVIPTLRQGGQGAAVAEPSGDRIEGEVVTAVAGGERTLRLVGLAPDAAMKIAGASVLRVGDGAKALSIPVARPARAMVALQQCIDSRMREWGIDPVAFAALRQAPQGVIRVIADDYPYESIMSGDQGTVIARLTSDVSGKINDCAVVVSSGSKPLDNATCGAALKRGRFSPAIGADGKPTASKFITRTTWVMLL